MSQVFVTSDTHFGHTKILEWCKRPFKTVDEMDEILIDNWNRVVRKQDIVYFLGDLAWKNWKYYFDQLNGQIHFIRGNHDKMSRSALLAAGVHSIQDIKDIKYGETYITLCHYPMRTWNKAAHGAIHFHGHCHTLKQYIDQIYSDQENILDIGIDGWDYAPIRIEDAIEHVKQRITTHNRK